MLNGRIFHDLLTSRKGKGGNAVEEQIINNNQSNRDFLLLENCPKYYKCSAPVCPLYKKLECTYNVDGREQYCSYMLDYCEGKETPIDYELRLTEKVWREILGKYLNRRLKDRVNVRKHFAKERQGADEEGIR